MAMDHMKENVNPTIKTGDPIISLFSFRLSSTSSPSYHNLLKHIIVLYCIVVPICLLLFNLHLQSYKFISRFKLFTNKATQKKLEAKMEDEHEKSLLNSSTRHRFPSMSLSCCFGGGSGRHRIGRSLDFDAFSLSPAASTPSKPAAIDHHPEIKGVYAPFRSRKGRNRRNSSADYSYDPQSYALNFEEPSEAKEPISSFTSRLPLSPPRRGRAPLTSLPENMSSTDQQKTSSRADVVAEVKKNLEFSTSMEELNRIGVDLPTAQRPRW